VRQSFTAAEQIARQRLVRQQLVSPTLTHVADVVRVLGAVQAQDYAGAKWAMGQRAIGVTDADVDRAFDAGAIIRTHVLRPTWHFVAPDDLRWMLALTAPRVSAAMGYYNRLLGLDRAVFRKSNETLTRALRDGRQRTRRELVSALTGAGVKVPTGQHAAHLLMQAELDGVICSGARRGKQHTYALLDERVPPAHTLERDEALAELTRRYFATRGPATLRDFSWWSGLTMADARRGAEAVGPFLQRLSEPRTSRRMEALQAHLVFVDGQIAGGWKRAPSKPADVRLKLLVPLTPAERKLIETAVRRLGRFLHLPLRIRQR
jgi:hypothetical protein